MAGEQKKRNKKIENCKKENETCKNIDGKSNGKRNLEKEFKIDEKSKYQKKKMKKLRKHRKGLRKSENL